MASKPKPRQTPLRARVRGSFYQEYVRGREALILIVAGGALTFLYWLGVLDEDLAASMFAGGVILGSSGYGLSKLSEATSNRALLAGLCLTAIAVAAIPVVQTLYPGAPAAHGQLRKPGDAFDLPESARGPVRVLLHGKIAGQGAAVADVVLDLDGHGSLRGQLTRTLNQARVGRRGSAMVVHEHNSEYLSTEVPREVHRVVLDRLDGALTGPLDISIFPDRVPLPIEIGLAAILLLLSAAVCARAQAPSSAVGGLGCALLFGILVSRMATPDEAVGPEVGAFLLSVVSAAIIAGVSVAAFGRLAPRAAAAARPT